MGCNVDSSVAVTFMSNTVPADGGNVPVVSIVVGCRVVAWMGVVVVVVVARVVVDIGDVSKGPGGCGADVVVVVACGDGVVLQ
jgi:hypothetical protein